MLNVVPKTLKQDSDSEKVTLENPDKPQKVKIIFVDTITFLSNIC